MGDKVDAEIERILSEADKDGDGQIDYEEFVEVRGRGSGCQRPESSWKLESGRSPAQRWRRPQPSVCGCLPWAHAGAAAPARPCRPTAADDQGAGEEDAGHEAVGHARQPQLM